MRAGHACNPDGVMFYKIWNGRAKPKMPAMKIDVTRTDVWAVIHYINTLRKYEPLIAEGVRPWIPF
jgi:hypothetical protein